MCVQYITSNTKTRNLCVSIHSESYSSSPLADSFELESPEGLRLGLPRLSSRWVQLSHQSLYRWPYILHFMSFDCEGQDVHAPPVKEVMSNAIQSTG